MSFTNRIQNYTNSTSNENVADALKKGLDYTLGVVKAMNPDMLRLFAYEINTGLNKVKGLDWEKTWNISYLIDVKKVNKFCRPVSDRIAEDLVDTSSIYYALFNDPVYYLEGDGSLTVKPEPVPAISGAGGVITGNCKLFGVPNSNGRTVHDANETVTINNWSLNSVNYQATPDKHFPVIFKELIVLHAAECILMERMADFRVKLPTDLDVDTTVFNQLPDIDMTISDAFPHSAYQDCLDKVQDLIDGTTMGGDTEPESAQFWLADEDEDMVASTLSVASQELQRAQAILAEFNGSLNASVTIKSQELKEFQANLQKKMGLFDKVIQKITVDYQWNQGQMQMLGQKKQEFIQSNIQIGPIGSPDKETKI